MVDTKKLKKALRYCVAERACDSCPYEGHCIGVIADSLEYIKKLENELKEDKK